MTDDAPNAAEPSPPAIWTRLYGLDRWQWVIVAVVVVSISVVNKAVIHDRGSNWFTLVMVAFFVGLAAAHLAAWVLRRTRSTATG